jgi:hypothetical protein
VNLTWLYVAFLYAIGSRLARVPVRVAVLFYLLVLLFLFAPLTQPVSIVPGDVVKLVGPWSELRPPNRGPVTKYEVSNLNLHDVTMQIVPWIQETRVGNWIPLLANGQSTPLSPLRLLVRPLPLAYAMNAEAALKLLLALTLMYLFCRTRYSMTGSVAAAIAFGFSTWMTTWLQFPIAAAAAFLPGVMLVIERLLDGDSPGRFVAAVLVFSATVLSGHPETVYHVGLFALAYSLWRAGIQRSLLRVFAAGIVAVLVCSPFLVVFAEAVLRSQRFAEMRAVRDSLVPPFSDLQSAVLLLQPRFFGELPIERPWGPTTLESICGFSGVLALASVIAALLFVVRGRRWRSPELLYIAGFLVSLGVVLGWPVFTEAFHAIAGLAPTMRMRLGLCWFGSLLIAPVIDWTRQESRVPILAGALIVSAMMLLALQAITFPSAAHRVSAVLSLLPGVAVLAALALPRVEAAVALTIVELFVTMSRWNPELPLRDFYPRTPLIERLIELGPGSTIAGTGGQLYPCVGAMFGFDDVRPHDPMANARYVDLLARKAAWNSRDYYAKWNDPDTPLLDDLGVRFVVTEPGRELAEPRFRLRYQGRDGRIYENLTAKPRFFSSEAEVEIEHESRESYSLRIRADREVLVRSTILHDDSWSVRGARRVRLDGVMLGLVVPPGAHDVEVTYRPVRFYVASAVSLLTLATLPALARRRRWDRAR